MKKIILISLFLFTVSTVVAQNRDSGSKTGVITCTQFNITRPIKDIFTEFPVDENKVYEKKTSGDRNYRRAQKFPFTVKDGPQFGNDPADIQRRMGTVPGRAPITSWAGQVASGFRPYDPSGAAGPLHYVQMINSTTFRIYNKTTGAVTLTGTLGNLWSPATANNGDPIVMYDKAADRWFLAQFGSSSGRQIYIAISTTNDPTGSYYTYTYVSPEFPDYLKFSVWADGYYMTSNQSQKVFAFDRAAMLAGTVGARAIYVSYSPPEGSGFFCPLPGDAADGTLPTFGAPCPIVSYSDNGWGAGYFDAVNIYQMAVDWVPTTPTANITLAANVSTAGFDASYDVNWNDVSQPGTTQKLDGIGGVCMYRAQWKSWGGYNTMVLNWGVKINTSQRSIKWCELRQNQSTGVWSMYQEGIYTPDASTRWMGGIAMDNNGSIGLSYMKCDTISIYPGLYYTGRRSCDPLGTLPVTETQVVAGTGYQTGTNRNGDYSHTSLDPDGITFWHTSEYMGGTSGGSAARTQIFSYQIPICENTAAVYISQTTGTNPQCPGASATFTATPVNGGATPVYQWQVNGSNVGTNSTTYTTTSLTNGQVVTCIMTSSIPGVLGNPATSNAITMVVNPVITPLVSIALTSGSNPTCPNTSLTFTATPTNGGATPAYQWKVNGSNAGTNSATFTTSTLTNGQVVTCVLTSNAICLSTPTATSNGITISINAGTTPTVSIAQTGGVNPQCAGVPATFTATVLNGNSPVYQWKVNGVNAGTNSATFTSTSLTNGQNVTCDITSLPACVPTLGTGTTLNATNSDVAAPYPTYYGNGRQQYLILASELTAIGLTAGNISSIGFSVAGTTGNPSSMSSYTIKIAATAATVLTTTFQAPVFTTVFGPVPYTPTLNTTNTHVFSAPFPWNGSSNLIIDICFSNQITGVTAYQTYQTNTAFVSTTYYQADGATGAGACTQVTGSGTGSKRPNMVFGTGAGLLSASSNTITMNINSSVSPSVAIAVTSGTNPQCAGAPITFTATPTNGGVSPSYQWKVNGVNAGTNSTIFSPSGLTNGQTVSCDITSIITCPDITYDTLGTGTGLNSTTSDVGAAYPTYYGSGRQQYLVLASELTALGMTAGSISSMGFKVAGTTGNPSSLVGYTIKMGATASTVLTTAFLAPTFTTVFGPSTYIPALNSTNIHTFSSPYNWNGTSNVLIDICFSNGVTGVTAYQTFQTTTAFVSTAYYQVDGPGGSTACTQVTGTGTGSVRPNMIFITSSTTRTAQSNVITMSVGSPTSNTLTTTACDSYVWAVNSTTYTASGTYTSTSLNTNNCTHTETLNLTIKNSTSASTTASACDSYVWSVNGTTYTSSGTYTSTSTNSDGCTHTESLSLTITSSVAPGVSISISAGTNPQCAGASATFTATPSNGGISPAYQWKKNGTNVGTNNVSYTDNALMNSDQVWCEMTSNENCATGNPAVSDTVTMIVNNCGSITLDLRILIEGYYLGNGLMIPVVDDVNYPLLFDTVIVELINAISPFNMIDQAVGTLSTSGNGSFNFTTATPGNSYFILVRHRNSLSTWSKDPVLFNTSVVSFDFTTE